MVLFSNEKFVIATARKKIVIIGSSEVSAKSQKPGVQQLRNEEEEEEGNTEEIKKWRPNRKIIFSVFLLSANFLLFMFCEQLLVSE